MRRKLRGLPPLLVDVRLDLHAALAHLGQAVDWRSSLARSPIFTAERTPQAKREADRRSSEV
eukprot:scaffold1178_cov252-Pinguiococcus_pyrenoidosus.AAC.25